ncbi:hypothetical protein PM082_019800 [Marasmius tenuissimus]|nr:hypothetical protein PM082_019800 [Marasmius tenuissimus]
MSPPHSSRASHKSPALDSLDSPPADSLTELLYSLETSRSEEINRVNEEKRFKGKMVVKEEREEGEVSSTAAEPPTAIETAPIPIPPPIITDRMDIYNTNHLQFKLTTRDRMLPHPTNNEIILEDHEEDLDEAHNHLSTRIAPHQFPFLTDLINDKMLEHESDHREDPVLETHVSAVTGSDISLILAVHGFAITATDDLRGIILLPALNDLSYNRANRTSLTLIMTTITTMLQHPTFVMNQFSSDRWEIGFRMAIRN